MTNKKQPNLVHSVGRVGVEHLQSLHQDLGHHQVNLHLACILLLLLILLLHILLILLLLHADLFPLPPAHQLLQPPVCIPQAEHPEVKIIDYDGHH